MAAQYSYRLVNRLTVNEEELGADTCSHPPFYTSFLLNGPLHDTIIVCILLAIDRAAYKIMVLLSRYRTVSDGI